MSAEDELQMAEDEPQGGEDWLMTFADLMTLLLCFFVLLFSTAEVKQKKWKMAAFSLEQAFSGKRSKTVAEGTAMVPAPSEINIEGLVEAELARIQKEMDEYIAEKELDKKVLTEIDARGLVITLRDDFAFAPGKVELSAKGLPLAKRLTVLLEKFKYDVRIEGHSDNIPIRTEQYPSNWELSSGRASQIVRGFIQGGVSPTRLSVEGFAEFRPLTTNDTPEGRAQNRRIELIFKRQNMVDVFHKRFLLPGTTTLTKVELLLEGETPPPQEGEEGEDADAQAEGTVSTAGEEGTAPEPPSPSEKEEK